MQEVNSLCTDSGPLRVNNVLCHFTQYILLVYDIINNAILFTDIRLCEFLTVYLP